MRDAGRTVGQTGCKLCRSRSLGPPLVKIALEGGNWYRLCEVLVLPMLRWRVGVWSCGTRACDWTTAD